MQELAICRHNIDAHYVVECEPKSPSDTAEAARGCQTTHARM